jgi:4-carboxymuconolactone decarboxylase
MAKLPYVSREDLPEDKRHVYDRIDETRGSVDHIFRLLLNSPDAAEAVTNVGEFIRFKSPLDPVVREIAILAVARETNSKYEWAQHEPVAQRDGVPDRTIEAIRNGRAPMGVPAKEGVYAQGVKELLRKGKMSEMTFKAIEHLLGPAQTLDFLVLVGYYSMLAGIMATLDIDLDEGLVANFPKL